MPAQTVPTVQAIAAIAGRRLPGSGAPAVQSTGHGGTTQVFRASRGGRTVYVRLAEERGESMRVEAHVHEELRRRGVRVPEVVDVWDPGEHLDRGAIVLAAVTGRPLAEAAAGDPGAAEAALRAAGGDIARIGRLEVDGFGFLEREPPPRLRAPLVSACELLAERLEERLARLAQGSLGKRAAARAAAAAKRHAWRLDDAPSRLAHGDLDPSHVYVNGRRYAGIIDLGEMRGAPPLYDVAHYAVHQRQAYPGSLQALLAGYAEAEPLPAEHASCVALIGLLIALRLLDVLATRVSTGYRGLLTDAVDDTSSALLD